MDQTELNCGQILQDGKYTILRVLGQGGFGITYEAEQSRPRRKVAIKEFFLKGVSSRDDTTGGVSVPVADNRELFDRYRKKFLDEADKIAAFDNSHIVRIFDVFEENGSCYYVMELLPGDSLRSLVLRDGPMSEEMAVGYILQVADALSFVHKENMLHLDVKPSNIMLNREGEAVLIDFGISKHYGKDGTQDSTTPVGLSLGFAPMELYNQGAGMASFSPATDVYSLGATLYFLVTGQVPPEAPTLFDTPLARPDGISDATWAALSGAMAASRTNRLQDVDSFASLLKQQQKLVAQAVPEDRTIIDPVSPAPKPAPKPAPPPPKKGRFPWWLVILILLLLGGAAAAAYYLKTQGYFDSDLPSAAETEVVEVNPYQDAIDLLERYAADHTNKDYRDLKSLYSDHVNYYRDPRFTPQKIVDDKSKAIGTNNYKLTLSDYRFDPQEDGSLIVRAKKTSSKTGRADKVYSAYFLLVRNSSGQWKISGENDTTTDQNKENRTFSVGSLYVLDDIIGVVVEVDSSKKHGKIVSLEEGREIPWCTESVYDVQTRATSYQDGELNQRRIGLIDGWEKKYPAFAWCASHGEGWYLPAIEELRLLNNDAVRKAVKKEGTDFVYETVDDFSYCLMWSSTDEGYDEYVDCWEALWLIISPSDPVDFFAWDEFDVDRLSGLSVRAFHKF